MTSRGKSRIDRNKVKREIQDRGTPRFSVILCTYNRCNLVLSALASLRRQTLPYNQFEVIVIDNGSSDGTLQAVQAYVRAGTELNKKQEDMWQVHCLTELKNGLAHARNTGLLAASGEIAVFLDDDTTVDSHFLEHLLKAYEETGAAAIGGRVVLHWEAKRPHWLSDELRELLGYYVPASTRFQLAAFSSFSSSNFSVKIEALRAVGYFSPFLSKRLRSPANTEVQELCFRLHSAGYKLWYEPEVIAAHRVPAARLTQPFFVGRAYWQGRSEVLMQYASAKHAGDKKLSSTISSLTSELREFLYLSLVHVPLLRLAGRSTVERLLGAMSKARAWGHLQQHLLFFEHTPAELTTLAVLIVSSNEADPAVDLLSQALNAQEIKCTIAITDIPLSWLWQHRASQGQANGVLHFYSPGAFNLTRRQRQQLGFRLWLARQWKIPVVTTDSGGWWQSSRSIRFLTRRVLERQLFQQSNRILGFTRQPEQLYPNKKMRRRVRCFTHPGFRGYFASPVERAEAYKQLGIPQAASFIYLCLAPAHTEHELLLLLEAFRELTREQGQNQSMQQPQLLLVGIPGDKTTSIRSSSHLPFLPGSLQGKEATRVLKFAASHPGIHLSMTIPKKEDMPLYLGAANAVVLPHLALHTAGMLETALLALSYGRIVVAPNLPRFNGMLPPRASILYDAGSRESLKRALLKAQKLNYSLNEKEMSALDAESGWSEYAHRLSKMYRELINSTTSAF